MTSGIWISLSIAFSIFIVVSVTACIVRRRKAKLGNGRVLQAPVVVTSASHTAPGGYPTGVHTVSVYPTSSSGYQQTAYPQQAPYPVSGLPTAMPMPMQHAQMQPHPVGLNPQMMPPYPPATQYPPVQQYPPANYSMNPPSYENAVGPNQSAYEKQAPYNPGYTSQY